jgi:predicted cupin superfamily sugar epimerase
MEQVFSNHLALVSSQTKIFMQEMHSLIMALDLQPHPEGGFYREMFRSKMLVNAGKDAVDKSAYTSIYYLLSGTDFSAWHRIKSDETWYFHAGCDVLIHFFDEDKLLQRMQLGFAANVLQATISANTWFSAKPLQEDAFCLVSCAVAPGFEFQDFEIGQRAQLLKEFGSAYKNIQAIETYTRV